MAIMTADAEHVFPGEGTSSREGSTLMLAKAYEGATLHTETVGVTVEVESCSKPMMDEGASSTSTSDLPGVVEYANLGSVR
jgi:hypothetical protein